MPKDIKRIFLVGFMACGKSFSGQGLAKLLDIPFIDLDEYIVEKEGKSIPEIFAENGEEGFRILESRYLKQAIPETEGFVLATGGGTPCFYGNMAWMLNHGLVVFIQTPLTTIIERMKMTDFSNRPLLKKMDEENLAAFLEELLEDRREYYLEADIIYNQTKKSNSVLDLYSIIQTAPDIGKLSKKNRIKE